MTGLYRADLARHQLGPAARASSVPRPAVVTRGTEARLRAGFSLSRSASPLAGLEAPESSPPAGTALGSRRYLFVARSGPATDDNGVALAIEGADLAGYRRNPVVLWAHDMTSPVGTAEVDVRGGRLMASIIMRPDLSPLAGHLVGLIEGGVLRGLSVGARLVRAAMSDDGRTLKVSRWRLVELSLTSMPADAGALRVA
jgi:HK97 family phage prohead protease